jgi:hypothetical protein
MSGTPGYDYSNIENDWLEFGFCLSAENRRYLQRLSKNVANNYSLSDHDAHEDLVFDLWRIMGRKSPAYLENGEIKIAGDTEPLKTVTENMLPQLNKSLQNAVDILHRLPESEVFRAIILDSVGENEDFSAQVSGLFDLAETISRASEFRGKAGKRRRPDWVRNFCVAGQKYWHKHGMGGTKLNFSAPNPPAITKWMEQVFTELRAYRIQVDRSFKDYRTSSPAALRKVAQALPAFRPPNEAEKGV